MLRDINYDLYSSDIYEVLNDSDNDPEYSAVYVNNIINCLIDISKEIGEQLPYNDVKGFMLYNDFSQEEYELFESKRRKESVYYIGPQY